MTAFNTAQYVAEAIESILLQETGRTWELLFVDDGSSDATLSIAKRYGELYPGQIFILTHADRVNHGISASRNLALRHARGAYVAFLDSDDVWLPCHLETLASLLDQMPDVSCVYGGAERWVDTDAAFDESTSRAATWGRNYLPPLTPAGKSAGLLPRGELLRWIREDESFVPCICSTMLRTAAARAVNGFCDQFRGIYDDQAFHAKFALRYDLFAQDVCVARYRQHSDSCCARARETHLHTRIEHRRLELFLSDQLELRGESGAG